MKIILIVGDFSYVNKILKARGSFSEEVLQSLNHTKFDDQTQNTSPSTENGDTSTDTDKPNIPERKKNRNSRGKLRNNEPDSGISSAISSTTRPWSQNDTAIDTDQVCISNLNWLSIFLIFFYPSLLLF